MEPNAHRSRSISDISSVSMVSVLCFYTICVRVLCVVSDVLDLVLGEPYIHDIQFVMF